jgi:hypothetical protein
MLSTLKVKSAKPEARAYKLADSGGLYLLVQPIGSKLWRYKFRDCGTEGLQALGAFPEIGLAEARGLHTDARKLVVQGINTIQARRDEKIVKAQEQLERINGVFATVVADWNAATAADLKPSTVRQRKREIDNDLLPTLKSRQIGIITRLELTTLLKGVEKRAPEVARNLRNHLWGVFEYAIDSGLIANNPVPPVRVLKKHNQKNHPALSDKQIGDFLRTLDNTGRINEEMRIAMVLVLLNGLPGEGEAASVTDIVLKCNFLLFVRIFRLPAHITRMHIATLLEILIPGSERILRRITQLVNHRPPLAVSRA